MERNETTGCLLCGNPLKLATTGRRRKYCSSRHRVAHYRRRKGTKTPTNPEAPNPTKAWGDIVQTWEDLLWIVNEQSLPSLSPLRRLATLAEETHSALEALEKQIDLFRGVHQTIDVFDESVEEIEEAIDLLSDHRQTLSELAELDCHVDSAKSLLRSLRQLKRLGNDLWLPEAPDPQAP